MTSFKSLRGVIIGLGSIGNRHLNNALSLSVDQMTVVRRPNAQNDQFDAPENVTVCHSLSDAMAGNPDFAIVCNPSHLHAATAIECMEAGLHVLIEKPLGRLIGQDEERLAELTQTSQKQCDMAYCMRFHGAYNVACEFVQSGKLGRVLYAKTWFEGYMPDWHPWEDHTQCYAALPSQGGGVLRTLDHEIDFMNWTLGKPIASTGMVHNTQSIGIQADDVSFVSTRHESGAISQTTVAFCRKPASRGFEFVGESGTLEFSLQTGQLWSSPAQGDRELIATFTADDIQQMYVDLLTEFLNKISTQTKSDRLATLADGLASLEVIQSVDPNPRNAEL